MKITNTGVTPATLGLFQVPRAGPPRGVQDHMGGKVWNPDPAEKDTKSVYPEGKKHHVKGQGVPGAEARAS